MHADAISSCSASMVSRASNVRSPGGAFYAYPNISSSYARGIKDSLDFSEQLLEQAHVAVVPGSAFGTENHIRISYATSLEQLDRGLSRIAQFIIRLDG